MMSSLSTAVPRTRWPDYIFPYVKSTAIFTGPLAPKEMMVKTFAHDANTSYGGYGINFQYLGNSRFVTGDATFPFTASESQIGYPAETIAITDTQGVRKDDGTIGAGEYTLDPPLPSLRGSGKPSGFYGEGTECGSGAANTPGQWGCRSTPAEWATGRVTIAWCDGHATAMPRKRMDDKNGDGQPDNGYWNGQADPTTR